MWPEFFELMTGGTEARHRSPVQTGAAAYVLMELEESGATDSSERVVELLDGLIAKGMLSDAAVARSHADRDAFWRIRNDIEHLIKAMSPLHAYDVSVPIALMSDYVAELRGVVAVKWPRAHVVVFGHVADNNLHVVISGPASDDKETLDDLVYAGVMARRGSISAEHGIGLDKRRGLSAARPPEAIAMMRQIKRLLDPGDMLNPGKVVCNKAFAPP
jgi:FAD/FMN-containing dehydrogenase